ncbi:MAG: hypothetical protein AAB384_01345 [Patescibacteria group bacterium]
MPRQPRISKAPVSAEPPASRRVLLVEPDAMLAALFKRRLTEVFGVTVDTVLTVRRMHEQLSRRQYRLVVADMSLNVATAIAAIKSHGAAAVVTTPGASPADVQELTAAGADAIMITTHCTPDGVVSFLRKFL